MAETLYYHVEIRRESDGMERTCPQYRGWQDIYPSEENLCALWRATCDCAREQNFRWAARESLIDGNECGLFSRNGCRPSCFAGRFRVLAFITPDGTRLHGPDAAPRDYSACVSSDGENKTP